jgi:hypothetical protein
LKAAPPAVQQYSWPDDNPPASRRDVLGINDVQIGEDRYQVRFFFDTPSHGLNLITIDPELKGKDSFHIGFVKSGLLDALTEKYGEPSITDPPNKEKDCTSYRWKWLFTKTVITLEYIDCGRLGDTIAGVKSILGVTYSLRKSAGSL